MLIRYDATKPWLSIWCLIAHPCNHNLEMASKGFDHSSMATPFLHATCYSQVTFLFLRQIHLQMHAAMLQIPLHVCVPQ